MPEDHDETGPTCLYKDGESAVYEGADVAAALAKGWSDSPNGAPSDGVDVEPVVDETPPAPGPVNEQASDG